MSVRTGLQAVVDEIQESLPLELADGTIIRSVALEREALVYDYFLPDDHPHRVVPDAFLPTMFERVRAQVCEDIGLAAIMATGRTLQFRYEGESGSLGTIVVTGDACLGDDPSGSS